MSDEPKEKETKLKDLKKDDLFEFAQKQQKEINELKAKFDKLIGDDSAIKRELKKRKTSRLVPMPKETKEEMSKLDYWEWQMKDYKARLAFTREKNKPEKYEHEYIRLIKKTQAAWLKLYAEGIALKSELINPYKEKEPFIRNFSY